MLSKFKTGGKRRRCHSVQFQDDNAIAPVLVHESSLDKKTLWYQDCEIDQFRTDARLLCRQARQGIPLPAGESVRGLEYRSTQHRQQRRQSIVKCIIRAQHRASSPRQLAHVYRRCSKWAIIAAAAMANNDFCEAYDLPRFACEIPPMADHPLPFRTKSDEDSKRAAVPSVSIERIVRQRTGAVPVV